jgi:hypothetical protein
VITYEPSPHFKQRLKDFDDHIAVRWVEHTETLEIWSALPNKRPVLEHSYCRNNKARLKPLFNWDMEWIVLGQLERARRWQHMTANEFQKDMLDKRTKFKEDGVKAADEEFERFLSDPYWHKKRLQEFDDNNFGKCTTQWAGVNPKGKRKRKKKNDENLES